MSAVAESGRIRMRDIVRRAAHPPVREPAFWAVQAMIVVWGLVHIEADVHSFANGVLPTGAPIDPLLIPVGYAALRYGLSGSAATAAWAALLWLPDLLLSNDRGHPYQDTIQLAVIIAVALFVGLEIERAHLQQRRAEAAEAERRAAELHYHRLFDTNTSPTLLVDADGVVAEANPAALALWGSVVGSTTDRLLGISSESLGAGRLPQTVRLEAGFGEERDYRISVSHLGTAERDSLRQLVLEDVTEEYLAGNRARAWAGAVLRAQEEECRRIAREIHDDPLQRLLQLARRMEALGSPADSAHDGDRLGAVRKELLGVVAHLRDVTRGLHPAGLDQLGLVAAVRGLLADVEVEEGLATELMVSGEAVRGSSEVEVGAFRIIQEAVRNVVGHAAADRLLVELAYDGDHVELTVSDDGVGFEQAGGWTRAGGHFGILGIRERASLLGGQCEVLSEPGAGTVVRASLPLRSAEAAPVETPAGKSQRSSVSSTRGSSSASRALRT